MLSQIRDTSLVLLLQAACFCSTVPFVYAADDESSDNMAELSNLESSKADLLVLDRKLSDLENEVLFPARTTLLFGISPKVQYTITQVRAYINNQPLPTQTLSRLQRESLQKGGMITLFDDNLPKSTITIRLEVEGQNMQPIRQEFNVLKRVNRNILALRLNDRVLPGAQLIKIQEWSND